jgi:predicted TPR repeat methyltransferase
MWPRHPHRDYSSSRLAFTMDSKRETPLTNANVRDFYDSLLKSFEGSYTDQRWHSSPLDEFEFRQTARALGKALGKRSYGRILEIGPGDGAWTPFLSSCAENLHVVDQSSEMLRRAKQRMAHFPGITWEHSDFIDSRPPSENDLIVAVRCFEYFDDKSAALRRMCELLAPGRQDHHCYEECRTYGPPTLCPEPAAQREGVASANAGPRCRSCRR